ncbi:MAG: hypothetical protein R6W70_10405 [bacterium]
MKNSSKSMIFHHSHEILENPQTGSQVRAKKMLEAFIKSGYEVEEVTGKIQKRKTKILEIKKKIEEGKVYDFCYSESATMPMLIVDKYEILRNFNFDVKFFLFLKKNSIPVGHFLRDIYWCFEKDWVTKSWIKKKILRLFYKYDLKMYNKCLDVLFVPTLHFMKYLPELNVPAVSLPPGNDTPDINIKKDKKCECLNFIYVGGVVPPRYNVAEFLKSAIEHPEHQFYLICRKKEWEKAENLYFANMEIPANLIVEHLKHNELADRYAKADISFINVGPHEYWQITWPIKFFESMGYGLPLLTVGDSVCAEFVRKNDLGWNINENFTMNSFIQYIQNNSEDLIHKTENVVKIRKDNSWQKRAEKAAKEIVKHFSQ